MLGVLTTLLPFAFKEYNEMRAVLDCNVSPIPVSSPVKVWMNYGGQSAFPISLHLCTNSTLPDTSVP